MSKTPARENAEVDVKTVGECTIVVSVGTKVQGVN